MRHEIVAPTHSDARRLAHVIKKAGWDARITTIRGKTCVLVHAPHHIMEAACLLVTFTYPAPVLEAECVN